jgi:hypothetical protein
MIILLFQFIVNHNICKVLFLLNLVFFINFQIEKTHIFLNQVKLQYT